eukprot:CAMPEP_0197077292 /NCGR_PEP_ID=MMETSP1384-20130603/212544_1 /TAXON_ID=29189 /ORGANISM="Ammonia sp." /LENGTH=386 /DNA_ID=CAMNT_0042516155 /DNA_START=83 /DNA_END=1243 /DNA_ORIENTATION=-
MSSSATVTYSINTSKISQTLSVVEWVIVLIITIINLTLVWSHYARSYNTFCAQFSAADRTRMMKEELEMSYQKKKAGQQQSTEQQAGGDDAEQKESVEVVEAAQMEVEIGGNIAKYYADSALLTILTCFALTCYFLASVYTLVIQSATKQETFCVNFVLPIVWMFTLGRGLQFNVYLARLDFLYHGTKGELFTLGRGLQFNVYLARLDFLYHGTKGEYAKSTLMILATIVAIICVVVMSLQAAYQEDTKLLINNAMFPYFCEFLLRDVSLISMLVFDVVLSIVSVILFWVPLGQVSESKDEVTRKMLKRFGWKYAMIVTVTAAWSALNYILLIIMKFPLLAPTMLTVNSLSLVLLGPYYTQTFQGCYRCLGFGTIVDMQQAIKKEA